MGVRSSLKETSHAKNMGKEQPLLHPVTSQTLPGGRQTKPLISSAPFPFTAALVRQHESWTISAAGEGGLFFLLGCTGPYGYEVMGKSRFPNRCHCPKPTVSFPDRVLICELVVQVDFLHILISVGISALP